MTGSGPIWLFAVLQAPFLAVALIWIYVGTVMVLILFSVMMLDLIPERLLPGRGGALAVFGAVMGGAIFCQLALMVCQALEQPAAPLPEGFGSVSQVGGLLFSGYLLPFEVVSLLLLVALAGILHATRGAGQGAEKEADR